MALKTQSSLQQYVELFVLYKTVPLIQGSANYSPWVKSGPLPVSANKVLLAHSHVHSLTCVTAVVELSSFNREHLVHKAKNITILPFAEKVCQPLF